MTTAVIDIDYKTKQGYTFKIIEYKDAHNIFIEFQDAHKARLKVESVQIKRGNIQNPYHRNTLGVGFLGQGRFTTRDADGNLTRAYRTWFAMLNRCYGKARNGKYNECSVHENWHNFQTFAEWFSVQKCSEIEDWYLDKDLLQKGNRVYSADTCVFLPQELNNFMNKREALRGNYLIGVSFDNQNGKFIAQGNFKGFRKKFIGAFYTEIDTFMAYKKEKEAHARFLAGKYAGKVDAKVITALLNYEVDTDD